MATSPPSTPFEAQPPREVTDYVIASIATALASEGFVHKKSAKKLVKHDGDFEFEIWFQSNRYNQAGVSVSMWIHASTSSKAFARWKKECGWPLNLSGVIGGGQIGNLDVKPEWLIWEFADPYTRTADIALAVARIRSSALTYFDLCQNREALLTRLSQDQRLVAFGLGGAHAMALALWLGDHELAGTIGRLTLTRPGYRDAYAEIAAGRAMPVDAHPQTVNGVRNLEAVARAFALVLTD